MLFWLQSLSVNVLTIDLVLKLLIETLCNVHVLITLLHFRLQLAAIHFNKNSQREQATTAEGVKRFHLSKPKYKKGKATVKAVKEPVCLCKFNPCV